MPKSGWSRVAECRTYGARDRKGLSSLGKISILGVLRLRATKRYVTRQIREALRSG
jgi:hypothetical protein